MAEGTVKIWLVGAGMFGGDVHLRAYADMERFGLGGSLARIGLDGFIREVAPVKVELAAVATRSERSAQRAQQTYADWTGQRPAGYHGETPWVDLLKAHPDVDILAVATPDHLHTPVVLAGLERGVHAIMEKPMCLDMAEAD